MQISIASDLFEQTQTGNRLHIPIRDDQAVLLFFHLIERFAAIRRFVDIFETDLLQKISHNPKHRFVIVNDEDRHVFIYGHILIRTP